MPKKKVTSGYGCKVCGKIRKSAHTDVLKNADGTAKVSTSECPMCFSEGKHQKYTFEGHVDSYGICELISAKCPTHGHIKFLEQAQPQPRFQRNFAAWMTGGESLGPPRIRKEI